MDKEMNSELAAVLLGKTVKRPFSIVEEEDKSISLYMYDDILVWNFPKANQTYEEMLALVLSFQKVFFEGYDRAKNIF